MSTLSDLMDFDHVIQVHEDGTIESADGIYAPELVQYHNADDTWQEDPLQDGWSLLDGFSGQWHYPGPMMHASEYIGGRMEDHIRANPGLYVAIYPAVIDADDPDAEADSWAVAFHETISASAGERSAS